MRLILAIVLSGGAFGAGLAAGHREARGLADRMVTAACVAGDTKDDRTAVQIRRDMDRGH